MLPSGPSSAILLRNTSTQFWKCYTKSAVFLFKCHAFRGKKLHRYLYLLYQTHLAWCSFHRKSAHDKVEINFGVPNCFTTIYTWCKNLFEYAGVPLIELIKLKAWLFAINSFTLALKSSLNIPAVKLFETTFFIALLIWLLSWAFCKLSAQNKYSHYLLQPCQYNVRAFGWNICLGSIRYPFLFSSNICRSGKMWICKFLTKFVSKNWD